MKDKCSNHLLAQRQDFMDEELHFIINYGIKYRMGWNNQEEEWNSGFLTAYRTSKIEKYRREP
jgi:hypothetical protein